MACFYMIDMLFKYFSLALAQGVLTLAAPSYTNDPLSTDLTSFSKRQPLYGCSGKLVVVWADPTHQEPDPGCLNYKGRLAPDKSCGAFLTTFGVYNDIGK
ncbi:MAG: hypothetical protein M1829_000061 [Trizodia sp. TS-e1964]|nr:MAG: hypothetical protein M1829_000061 [Trizodia sp. TS-e1964]